MASPTPNKGYTYPAHGGAVNAWDSPLNVNFDEIDLNLGGAYDITYYSSVTAAPTFNSSHCVAPSTGATVTLLSSIAQNLAYNISGTIAANQSVVWPSGLGALFTVNNQSSGAFNYTVTPAGGGTSYVVNQGGSNILTSDGINIKAADTNNFSTTSLLPVTGFNSASNLQLNATVVGNVLTVSAVAADTGTTPTAASPITIKFRDSTLANGDPVTLTVTSALSVSTAVGATLGTSNNVPFRFWIVVFNNAGTAALGLINCSTSSAIYPLNESGVASSTAIGAGSTSAGVFYTTGAITSKAFRIVGFLSYETALATAGTYNNAPDVVQLFGPGVKKPGEIVQTKISTSSTAGTTTSATFAALTNGVTCSLTPTSKTSLVRVYTNGTFGATNAGDLYVQLANGVTLIGYPIHINVQSTNATLSFSVSLIVLELPGSVSAVTYGIQGKTSAGTLSYPLASTGIVMQVEELMG